MVKFPRIYHERTAEVYSVYSTSREFQIQSRRDQTLLAKLHIGKYKGLHAYKSLLDGSVTCLCQWSSRGELGHPRVHETYFRVNGVFGVN